MGKCKVGLHKHISAIFDGVPISGNNHSHQSCGTATASYGSNTPCKLPTPVCPPTPAVKPKHISGQLQKQAPHMSLKSDDTEKMALQILGQQIIEKIKEKFFIPKPGVSTARQVTTAVLLLILLIVLIFMLFHATGPASPDKNNSNVSKSDAALAGSNINIGWQVPAVYPQTLRDPMQIVSGNNIYRQGGEIIVRGIVHSDDKPSAIIGTKVYFEGNKIGDTTVVKINMDSVELETNGKKWTQRVQ